nr:T9SS type A sorting domain-containing protein [uncultured Flavobacterium sp.]
MKKLYALSFILLASLSFGQVILKDNLNYTDNSLLTNNGWVAHSSSGSAAIDVGASNGLTYSGYSGLTGVLGAVEGNAAKLDNTGEDISKTFTPVTTGTIYYSFLVNVTNSTTGYFIHLGNSATTFAARVFVKPSATSGKINFGVSNTSTAVYSATPTDFDLNTTYLIIVKYDVSSTGSSSIWIKSSGVPLTEVEAGAAEATASGSGITGIERVCLRQYSSTQSQIIDGILVAGSWLGTTPCSLTLATETSTCNATTLNVDTYNVSIPFTGGNTGTYNLLTSAGTLGGDNPSTVASGNILITNIPEGTNLTLTVTGACSFTKNITAPECKIINTLPFAENFDYTVGNSLGAEQKWTNVNTGDIVAVTAGNLTYTGISSSGNSISFTGAGIETFTPFTATTAGTVYYSFLMNITDLTNVTSDLTETYFAGLTDGLKNYMGRLFVKKNATQYNLGFDSASTTTNYDATLRTVGDVVLVVMGYDFAANKLSAWFNPDLSTFTAATPATLVSTPATAIANLGGFMLRQDSDTKTPAITIDELKISTSIPLSIKQNSISGLKVYPNPVKDGNLYLTSNSSEAKTVAVYDILGKEVLNAKTSNNTVNVSSLKGGAYVIKITQDGNTDTRKLIIE